MNYAFQELAYLAEILGPERPEILSCLEKVARNPALTETYLRHFQRLLKMEGHSLADPPAFGRLSEKDKQLAGIPLGRIVGAKGDELFCLPFGVFREKHVGIYGATGSGKTCAAKMAVRALIENGHKVLIFDRADEYLDLAQFFPTDVFLVIDPKDLKINFLQPPRGVERAFWRGALVSLVRETMFLRDGACNELSSILENLDRNRPCPSFSDLYNAILKKSYRANSRRAQFIESLLNRSEALMKSYIADALKCMEGHPLEEVLVKRSSALRIGRIPDDMVNNFYVGFLLQWLEAYLMFNPGARDAE